MDMSKEKSSQTCSLYPVTSAQGLYMYRYPFPHITGLWLATIAFSFSLIGHCYVCPLPDWSLLCFHPRNSLVGCLFAFSHSKNSIAVYKATQQIQLTISSILRTVYKISCWCMKNRLEVGRVPPSLHPTTIVKTYFKHPFGTKGLHHPHSIHKWYWQAVSLAW